MSGQQQWQPITDEHKNGEDWIVGYEVAGEVFVRVAWWDAGDEDTDCPPAWWSCETAVSSIALIDHREPKFCIPLPPLPGRKD